MTSVIQTSYYPYDKGGFMPQEELYMLEKQQRKLAIGIPREDQRLESRVPLTPLAVSLLCRNGHTVVVQKEAGIAAHYSDKEYMEAGAQIHPSTDEIYKSDIVLKIAPPTPHEIELLKGRQTIISALHFNSLPEETIHSMMRRKVIALAYENIRDGANTPIITQSMEEIEGTSAMMIASEYLCNVNGGKGVLLGGITGVRPAKVVILGAGTAGEFAARTAMGLGALVTVFDSSIHKLRQLQRNLGQQIFTSVFQPQVLTQVLRNAEVLIGAVDMRNKKERYIVTEQMVRSMKPNSVIVDLSIDHGGCVETSRPTTHNAPVFREHNVIHYCVPNVPSRVARTASIALSNIFVPILMKISEVGGVEQVLLDDLGLRQGVYVFSGILTNSLIGKKFGIPTKDINLLMAAY